MMLKYVLLAIALLIFAVVAVTLVLVTVVFIALGCAVGIPVWLMARHKFRARRVHAPALRPVDRLKNLYIEGKIDLLEFEHRLARLISIEQ
ncbi:MAG: hypothetical protein ACRDFX_06305 [Chloroflexota bacterium]